MKEVKGFKNSYILTEQGIIKTNLLIENGIITKIGDFEVDGLTLLDEDKIVVPGFIDEHIHGSAGSDVIDGTIASLTNIAESLLEEGTTAFLATTTTSSKEVLEKSLANVKEYIGKKNNTGALLLGIHLEGPFISHDYLGAQHPDYVDVPLIDTFEHYNKVSGNNILLVTLAAEVNGGVELIEYLSKHNIVASVGHSAATYDDILCAIKKGLSCVTHTYNAQKPIHHREIGTVGAAMLCDCLYSELICDGIHVSIPAVKLLCKNKPLDKVILITDSLRGKYLEDGVYLEPDGQKVIVKDNIAKLENGTIAGSILKMNQAVKNIMDYAGINLVDAVRFATENPARNLGVFDKLGSIKEGKLANLLVIDKDINIYKTIRNGFILYENKKVNV